MILIVLSKEKNNNHKNIFMKAGIRFLSVMVLSTLMGTLSAQMGQGKGGQRVQRTPEEIAKTQVDWMKTDLKLDETTQKKVYDVVLKYAKQSSEERQRLTAAGERDAMRAKITEINAARDKELKVILGEKNYELFKSKESERRQAMMQQRQN
jgi:DNA-directed RNA polymerase subunit F